jgi:hypothetical protein
VYYIPKPTSVKNFRITGGKNNSVTLQKISKTFSAYTESTDLLVKKGITNIHLATLSLRRKTSMKTSTNFKNCSENHIIKFLSRLSFYSVVDFLQCIHTVTRATQNEALLWKITVLGMKKPPVGAGTFYPLPILLGKTVGDSSHGEGKCRT